MVAALLYAGQGAVLSHATAAWWWGLLEHEPKTIELSSPRRVRRAAGVVVHRRRYLEATRHRRFPITALSQTFLDLAATQPFGTVREALAQADYRNLLEVGRVADVAGRGKPGSAKLRDALKRHEPRLVNTRSELERAFFTLCEGAGLPLPELNVRLAGWMVDALWPEQRVVVELDGHQNHRSPAQIERDRRKDLELRAAGFIVLRYTWTQVIQQPGLVIADLRAALGDRAA
jgi:hypothetical protein